MLRPEVDPSVLNDFKFIPFALCALAAVFLVFAGDTIIKIVAHIVSRSRGRKR